METVKLTEKQQELKDELDRGVKVMYINTHRRSGGDLVLENNHYNLIYKTFWGLMHKLYGYNPEGNPSKQYYKK